MNLTLELTIIRYILLSSNSRSLLAPEIVAHQADGRVATRLKTKRMWRETSNLKMAMLIQRWRPLHFLKPNQFQRNRSPNHGWPSQNSQIILRTRLPLTFHPAMPGSHLSLYLICLHFMSMLKALVSIYMYACVMLTYEIQYPLGQRKRQFLKMCNYYRGYGIK